MSEKIDLLALVVALFAFILSLVQFVRESSRQKKESTLDAYNELQKDVFDKLNKLNGPICAKRGTVKWDVCTDFLAKIERFSVGVNTGIYSIYVLNRLAGGFFIHEYNNLSLIIQRKRIDEIVKGGHYDEFEMTVKRLKKYRKCKTCIGRGYLRIKWFIFKNSI